MQISTTRFEASGGLTLAADTAGDPQGTPVLLLHGGGQTRHAWGGALINLAERGFRAISLDLRGHGDSDWAEDGNYRMDAHIADLRAIVDQLGAAPALVGASLGGMTSLVAEGEASEPFSRALVLVDITPRIEWEGARRIGAFMTGNPDGFATLDEAADAIAAYLPHRPRPKDPSGLKKNLRLGDDGRWRWHWDPRMLSKEMGSKRDARNNDRSEKAARSISVPTLLVRGGLSDIVSEQGVREFLELLPSAEYVDVPKAGHMVAGDRNDIFNDAVVGFLSRELA